MSGLDPEILADAVASRVMDKIGPKLDKVVELGARVRAMEEKHHGNEKLRRGVILTILAGVIPAILSWGGILVMYVNNRH